MRANSTSPVNDTSRGINQNISSKFSKPCVCAAVRLYSADATIALEDEMLRRVHVVMGQ